MDSVAFRRRSEIFSTTSKVKTMNREEVIELFEKDIPSSGARMQGDDTFDGLSILSKYTDGLVLCAAEHDRIYSIDIDEALEGGITDEELIKLRGFGFMVEDGEYFSSFV